MASHLDNKVSDTSAFELQQKERAEAASQIKSERQRLQESGLVDSLKDAISSSLVNQTNPVPAVLDIFDQMATVASPNVAYETLIATTYQTAYAATKARYADKPTPTYEVEGIAGSGAQAAVASLTSRLACHLLEQRAADAKSAKISKTTGNTIKQTLE